MFTVVRPLYKKGRTFILFKELKDESNNGRESIKNELKKQLKNLSFGKSYITIYNVKIVQINIF